MSADNIILPPGFVLIDNPDGTQEVVAMGERLNKTVAFRVTASEYMALLPFFEAFPGGRGSVALRWLVSQPEVMDVIRRKVDQGTVHS